MSCCHLGERCLTSQSTWGTPYAMISSRSSALVVVVVLLLLGSKQVFFDERRRKGRSLRGQRRDERRTISGQEAQRSSPLTASCDSQATQQTPFFISSQTESARSRIETDGTMSAEKLSRYLEQDRDNDFSEAFFFFE